MEFLETQSQRDIEAAKVEEARANVAIAEIALQQTKLYAPISGVVSRPLIKDVCRCAARPTTGNLELDRMHKIERLRC